MIHIPSAEHWERIASNLQRSLSGIKEQTRLKTCTHIVHIELNTIQGFPITFVVSMIFRISYPFENSVPFLGQNCILFIYFI